MRENFAINRKLKAEAGVWQLEAAIMLCFVDVEYGYAITTGYIQEELGGEDMPDFILKAILKGMVDKGYLLLDSMWNDDCEIKGSGYYLRGDGERWLEELKVMFYDEEKSWKVHVRRFLTKLQAKFR